MLGTVPRHMPPAMRPLVDIIYFPRSPAVISPLGSNITAGGGAFSVHISSENGLKAYVTEGEEVLTLRPEERGTQKLFVPHKYDSKRKWEPSLMEWCCVKRCTNQEWTDMFERLREVSRKIGVKNAGQRMAGLGKVAWRKRRGNLSYQQGRDWTLPSTESRNCGSLSLEAWNVDIHKALRICEERHVTVEGSEGSYVSFDRVDDPWPSSSCEIVPV